MNLLARLRLVSENPADYSTEAIAKLCSEAADEIEYLRSVAGPVAKATDLVNEVKGRRAKAEDEK